MARLIAMIWLGFFLPNVIRAVSADREHAVEGKGNEAQSHQEADEVVVDDHPPGGEHFLGVGGAHQLLGHFGANIHLPCKCSLYKCTTFSEYTHDHYCFHSKARQFVHVPWGT